MTEVFRISKSKYIHDISGHGAKLYGGRWNRPGLAALYTSSHRSLALLELIVHFESSGAIADTFRFAKISVPEERIVDIDFSFTDESDFRFNNEELWGLTEYYFFELNYLGIWVPSAIVPQEKNLILNPQHLDFKYVKVLEIEKAQLDQRLL
jgi:RES domain-containing protein